MLKHWLSALRMTATPFGVPVDPEVKMIQESSYGTGRRFPGSTVPASIAAARSLVDGARHSPSPVKIAAEATGAAIESSGVLLRKGQPALRAAINKALGEIKADGTYKAISERYFGVDVSKH